MLKITAMNNKFIKEYVQENYGFDLETASTEDLAKVEEIVVNDVTGFYNRDCDWDFRPFPNLRILDCGYNFIKKLDVSQNLKLEKLKWAGTRGGFEEYPDISNNKNLKSLIAGQDSTVELDLSNNEELESLTIYVTSEMRWLDVSCCKHLKEIDMEGVNIPFVDLTECNELSYVNINYLNLYRNREDEFGDGYPRPLIFVNESFDENVIKEHTRKMKDYAYYLVRIRPNSAEEKLLNELKERKAEMIDIPEDRYGRYVAIKHYEILDRLYELRNQE